MIGPLLGSSDLINYCIELLDNMKPVKDHLGLRHRRIHSCDIRLGHIHGHITNVFSGSSPDLHRKQSITKSLLVLTDPNAYYFLCGTVRKNGQVIMSLSGTRFIYCKIMNYCQWLIAQCSTNMTTDYAKYPFAAYTISPGHNTHTHASTNQGKHILLEQQTKRATWHRPGNFYQPNLAIFCLYPWYAAVYVAFMLEKIKVLPGSICGGEYVD